MGAGEATAGVGVAAALMAAAAAEAGGRPLPRFGVSVGAEAAGVVGVLAAAGVADLFAFVLGVDLGVVGSVAFFAFVFGFGVGADGVVDAFFRSLAAVGVVGTGFRDVPAEDGFAGSLEN